MKKQEEQKKEKPVKEGERLTIQVDYEGEKGDGVTRKDNFIIIIKNAKKKKIYEIEITAVYATYAFAKILKEVKTNEKKIEEEEI